MALREILASFGFAIDDSKLKKASGTVDRVANGMRGALGVLAAGAVVAGVKSFVSDLQETADQLIDTSAQLGVSAQDLQRWQLAAKLSGAQATDLAVGLKNISKQSADAGGAAKLKKLGVDIKGANGEAKNATQLMRDTGLAIAAIKNPTERTAKALEVFGKSGNKLLPIFNGGAEELDKLLGRLDELGGGLGDDALEILEKSGDAADELSVSFLSLKSRLAVALFPALKSGIDWLSKTFAWMSKAAKGTKIFQSAAIVMAGAVVIALVSMYASFIPIIAVIALIILAVDDLWTAWEGGDSVIGRITDSLFGVGTTKEVVESLHKTVEKLNDAFGKTPGAANKAKLAISLIGAGAEEGFSVVGEKIVAKVVQWADDLTAPGSAAGAALSSALWSAVAGLPGQLTELVGGSVQAFGQRLISGALEVQGKALDFGRSVITGIAKGITDASNEAYAAIGEVASGILAKIKAVFKSGSPARNAVPFGASLPQGLAVGVTRHAREAEDATEDMGGRVLKKLPTFQLSPGQRTAAAPSGASRGSSGPVNIEHTTNAKITIEGGSPSVRADVKRGMMDATAAGRDALLASVETVLPSVP